MKKIVFRLSHFLHWDLKRGRIFLFLLFTLFSFSQETTPLALPGSEAFVFRTVGDVQLRLHVVKPKGWTKESRRPCFVTFFGGGWASGTPERSIGMAKWAAEQGFIGIAPDYRTREHFKGTPEDCISDARMAICWIGEHANELGIDPSKMICEGDSAGGHLALWTAISKPGPGKDDPGPPSPPPIALILLNPVTDTTAKGYGGPRQFGGEEQAKAASATDQITSPMPATLLFHGKKDGTVLYSNSSDFRDKMVTEGNRCELISFEELGHGYYFNTKKYGPEGKAAREKTKEEMLKFLVSLDLIGDDKTGK